MSLEPSSFSPVLSTTQSHPLQVASTSQEKSSNFSGKSTLKKVAYIGLGLLAASVVGYGIYQLLQPSSLKYSELDAQAQQKVRSMLESQCQKAVESHCITDSEKTLCLKDYLSPLWKPKVTIENYDTDILCPVNIQHPNCSEIVYQPTINHWEKGIQLTKFKRNFEEIVTTISPSNIIYKIGNICNLLRTHQESWKVNPDQIAFKSHVFCDKI